MEAMGNKEWLDAVNQVHGMMLTLWTVYAAIAAAVLALIASGREILQKPALRVLIIVGFWVAAIVNLVALVDLRYQHDIMVSYLVGPQMEPLRVYMLRPSPKAYIAIHLCINAAISFAVWFVPGAMRKT